MTVDDQILRWISTDCHEARNSPISLRPVWFILNEEMRRMGMAVNPSLYTHPTQQGFESSLWSQIRKIKIFFLYFLRTIFFVFLLKCKNIESNWRKWSMRRKVGYHQPFKRENCRRRDRTWYQALDFAVIGYLSVQDSSIFPTRDYPPCPARK